MTDDPSTLRTGRGTSPYNPVGAEIGPYRVEAYLDRGGMASVYEAATDLGLNRTVALKVLAQEISESADFRERFIRESRFAASLDQPNIVPIYEAGEADGRLYIAMRYVRGGNLAESLRKSRRRRPVRRMDPTDLRRSHHPWPTVDRRTTDPNTALRSRRMFPSRALDRFLRRWLDRHR